MKTPETFEQITKRAAAFAKSAGIKLNSGHLLLAILTGAGVAANTLSLRGLTETKVRARLREDLEESDEVLNRVQQSTLQIARSVRSTSIGAIHLLAGIATVKECRGHQIMRDCDLNVDTIRVQSLRNMTSGFTREHGHRSDNQQLNLAMKDSPRAITQKSKPSSKPSKETRPPKKTLPAQKKRVIVSKTKGVGRQLEQAQKKMRTGGAIPVDTPSSASTSHATVSGDIAVSQFSLTPKDYPVLCTLGRNLTQEAADGVLKPIVGRVAEIEQIADILNKKRANCPCLVGPPGVGKTAIVEGLACDMLFETVSGFDYEVIVEVSLPALLGGTTLRGELSEKIIEATKEIGKSQGKVILFFDDVHTLLGSADATEAVTELKSAMGRGEIPCIFATTESDFNKYVDPALARLMTTIDVTEPREEEALEILAGVAPDYEAFHDVKIDTNALRASVVLSSRYISDSYLPDKAVSIIDLAASQVKRRGGNSVQEADVATVLAQKIGVPEERLKVSDAHRLLDLEQELSQDIIGHHHALSALGETLRRNAAGFHSGRPIGSFLFLGPTGVGKTETAKTLARLLFADEKAMIRLDMSEFSEAHAVARMIGAPPGYIGHEDGGQLTDAVRRRPYSLVLLDEIEKAHRDVIQSLLQVLDDGRLTDGKGKTVDFKNTVIIMTSNLGSDMRQMEKNHGPVGFGHSEIRAETNLKDTVTNAARAALPPELWNRIDEPLVFEPLTQNDVARIARLMLNKLAKQIYREREIALAIEDEVIDHLIVGGGFDMQLGARPMRRTISRMIEGPLARIILGESNKGDTIEIAVNDEELYFRNIRGQDGLCSGTP
ncbi:MAG: ATP-dependent Clp protease ATP-binding subunit [Deltaproteobacteria bacterium]|nr:ATP-dependent Clp protease ATP-binding subunit [Deltaproteobacteria bacterium]